MAFTRRVLCAIPVLSFAASVRAQSPPEVDEILSKIRAAIGYERLEHVPAVRVTGKTDKYGVVDEYEHVFDRQGRFRESTRGDLSETVGFDGSTCWTSDWSHASRPLDLSDRERCLVVFWVQCGHWLSPGVPLDIQAVPEEATEKRLA